jgi:hypothetical protein
MFAAPNFFTSGSKEFAFTVTIATDTQNYNLKTAAIAAGWDQVAPLIASITINTGITVGSSSTATYAFDTGATFPIDTTLALTTIGTGRILGKGGQGGANGTSGTAGGPALHVQAAISITNNGTIGGGGGGGGNGEGVNNGAGYATGGGGGGGAGNSIGLAGGTGSNGTATTGGAGGPRGTSGVMLGGIGGAGGNLGSNGTSGGSGANAPYATYGASGGGTGGAAVVGNSYITWITTGTRSGSIS